MTQLNSEYRGKAKPTDVLSFPSDPFYWNQGVLGDLVLCGPVLVAQAKDHRHAWKKEADVLMIHGLLHLLGYDHELGKKQANQMARLEKKLLEQSRSRGMGLIARSGEIG